MLLFLFFKICQFVNSSTRQERRPNQLSHRNNQEFFWFRIVSLWFKKSQNFDYHGSAVCSTQIGDTGFLFAFLDTSTASRPNVLLVPSIYIKVGSNENNKTNQTCMPDLVKYTMRIKPLLFSQLLVGKSVYKMAVYIMLRYKSQFLEDKFVHRDKTRKHTIRFF